MNEDDLAMSYAARLTAVADSIPLAMLEDIRTRLGDWALSGGSMSADYVLHLVQNAERMAAMNNGGAEDEA
ncbi:DUF6877 family protein [Lacticaseibacillus saniviri]|uniref:DUF6877 family protein n=1 Tax=Lacticaseibacillus saniviri TaxID=931533 RepID=UPI0007049AD0|nr:DUF6877 family protein [Lacticaseibacillus saniviri]